MADQFQYVKLPNGEYGKFRTDATDSDIRSAIQRDFPNAFSSAPSNLPKILTDNPTYQANVALGGKTTVSHPKPPQIPVESSASDLLLGGQGNVIDFYQKLGKKIGNTAVGMLGMAQGALGGPGGTTTLPLKIAEAIQAGKDATPPDAMAAERGGMKAGTVLGVDTPAVAESAKNRDWNSFVVESGTPLAAIFAGRALPGQLKGAQAIEDRVTFAAGKQELPNVRQAMPEMVKTPYTGKGMVDFVNRTEGRIRSTVQGYLDKQTPAGRAGDTTVSGQVFGQKLLDYLAEHPELEKVDPSAAKTIENTAYNLSKHDFTLDELNNIRKGQNATNNPFYKKSGLDQIAELMKPAENKVISRTLEHTARETLYDNLGKLNGIDPKSILEMQKAHGGVMQLRDAIMDRLEGTESAAAYERGKGPLLRAGESRAGLFRTAADATIEPYVIGKEAQRIFKSDTAFKPQPLFHRTPGASIRALLLSPALAPKKDNR